MADMKKAEEAVKKLDVKKIVLIVVGLVLVLNIFATIMNGRYDELKVGLDQVKVSAEAAKATDGISAEIATIKQDVAAMQKSLDELKKFTEALARSEYEGFKAELAQLSSHVEEVGKLLGN